MASEQTSGGALVSWYRNRIGEPSTDDEATGYWLFAVGVILGVLGIVLFLPSQSAGTLRQWAIVLAAAGLVLLLAGPIIRLPLRRAATWLVYLGVLICAAAIVWFVVAFPAQWSPQTGQPTIISLYALGLLAMALGGVFVPILTDRAELEAQVSALQAELDDLHDALRDTQADEGDLADLVTSLRRALEDADADEDDLARAIDSLRGALDDTQADEGDLAAYITALRDSQAQFEMYQDRADEWRWRLRHRNGNLVADSGEGYTRKHNAQKGLQSVRRNALGAPVVLLETEAELPAEDGDDGFVFPDEESRATFELYEDRAGEARWRLRHDNGNILADSGEGYASRSGARDAIGRIQEYAGPAAYLRPDPTAFEIYLDRAGEWRWRLVHRNGNILADSGEGYANRSGAREAVARLQERMADLDFEIYEDSAGEHRWRLRSANNRIVADSGEGYTDRAEAEDATERVREYAPEADVLDIGRAAFEVYQDQADEWRWRLRARNGNILADSGEGYASRSGTWEAIESVKRNAPDADTEEE